MKKNAADRIEIVPIGLEPLTPDLARAARAALKFQLAIARPPSDSEQPTEDPTSVGTGGPHAT